MRQIQCKRCGAIISVSGEKYLCDSCAKKAKQESVVRDRTCRECGAIFKGGPRAWFCPDCRKQRQKKQTVEYHRRKAAGKVRPIWSKDICKICGAPYIVESSRQMYCPDCAEDAVKEVVSEQKKLLDPSINYQRKIEAHKNRVLCKVCGKPFTANTATVTCSPECAAEWKRIQQNTADIKRGKRLLPADQRRTINVPQSGVPGVTYHDGKWQATYKGKYIGIYETIDAAAEAIEAVIKSENPDQPVKPAKRRKHPNTSSYSAGDVIGDWQVLFQSEPSVSPKGLKFSQWLCRNVKTGERMVLSIFQLNKIKKEARKQSNGTPKESTTVKYPPFDLVSPEGEIYHVESMQEFVRNHVRLFCPDESVPENVAATRAINGIHGLLATACKGVPYVTNANSYKGWTVQVDPGVKLDHRPHTKSRTFLPADLIAPDGTVYHVKHLTAFVREHISEFYEGSDVPEEKVVKRAAVGLGQIISTANGASKGYPVYAYKGWMVKDPPVPRKSKCAMRGSHLPVDLESPEGKVYHVESPLNFAREHIKDFFPDGAAQDDIAVRRITGGINQLVCGKTTTYKGWKIAEKEGNDND